MLVVCFDSKGKYIDSNLGLSFGSEQNKKWFIFNGNGFKDYKNFMGQTKTYTWAYENFLNNNIEDFIKGSKLKPVFNEPTFVDAYSYAASVGGGDGYNILTSVYKIPESLEQDLNKVIKKLEATKKITFMCGFPTNSVCELFNELEWWELPVEE